MFDTLDRQYFKAILSRDFPIGTFEEGFPGAMPATLIHGVYDDVPVVYTELVNCPDWLPLVIWVAGDRLNTLCGQHW